MRALYRALGRMPVVYIPEIDMATVQKPLKVKAPKKVHGKRQGHIGNWLHRDKKVPAEACLPIERATGGKVTRYDLRPDIFGEPPAKRRRKAA